MPTENDMNNLVQNIKNICKKYSLNISARISLALIVEFFITGYELDDIQDVFTENNIIDPPNVWDATIEVIEYLDSQDLKVLVKHFDYTNKSLSYVKFQLDDEKARIDFIMTPWRSDYKNGSYTYNYDGSLTS